MSILLTCDEKKNFQLQLGDKMVPVEKKLIQQFNQVKILSNGSVGVSMHDGLTIIVDPSIYSEIFGEVEMRMIEAGKERLAKIDSIVPNGLKDKYCLIFGGKVFDHADTMEEIDKISKEKYPGLLMTTYKPCVKA